MAKQISVNKAKAHVMTGNNLGSPLADEPRPGTKRPFHDWSATSQVYGRQDITLNQEDGLISLHNTDSIVSSALLRDREARTHVDGDDDDSFHIEKRPRTSDWPLRSTTTINETHSLNIVPLRDRYDTLDSPSPPLCMHVKPRSSKFVEGSMNDRASQKPHSSYIGDYEQLQEQFGNIENDTDTKTHTSGLAHCTNRSVVPLVHNDKSEVSRASGIFRFGKSIVAAFNPSSWKIWSKQQEENNQDKTVLKERQEKAEKIYKELKRTGQFKGSTYETHLDTHDKSIPVNRHDSGVDLEYCSSRIDGSNKIGSKAIKTRMEEEKRHARIFLDTSAISSFAHDESAASELSAPSRSSSSQNRELTLKTGETSNGPQALRRLPSRKDLQKQQKLVKRVSDLEGKLEAARRQLAEALGEPVPTQTSRVSKLQFTLGTLASLPSERLLSVYTTTESDFGDADTAVELGRAVSMDDPTSTLVPNDKDRQETKCLNNTTSEPPETMPSEENVMESNTEEKHDIQTVDLHLAEDRQVEQAAADVHRRISDNLMSTRNTTKRKSSGVCVTDDGGSYRPSLETEDDDSSETPKQSIPKRRPGRPRKLQKVDPEPKLLGAEATETEQAASRDIVETYSPRSSQDRTNKTSKDRRVVLSKKAPVSPSNKHIRRKGHYSTPPPLKSSGITYPGRDVSAGMKARQDGIFRHVVDTVPSASVDVPPIPKLPNVGGQPTVVPASNGIIGSGRGTNSHDKVDGDQIRSQVTTTVTKNGKADSEQAFEWPPDVF